MTGREKCKALRAIRRKIAKLNGIEYKPAVCRHKGPCAGVCPKCEQEADFLMSELKRLEAAGQEVRIDPDCMKKIDEITRIEPDNEEMETFPLGIVEPNEPVELAGVPTIPDDDVEVIMGDPVIRRKKL